MRTMLLSIAVLVPGNELVAQTSKGKELDGRATAAFSPDGSRIAHASGTGPGYTDILKVVETARGKEIWSVNLRPTLILQLLVTPDGKYVLTSHQDKSVKIWDAASGKALASVGPHPREVRRMFITPDSERLLALCYHPGMPMGAREIICWHLPSQKEVFSLRQADRGIDPLVEGDSLQLQNFGLSPDGSWMATPSDAGLMKAWETKSGKEVVRVAHPFRPWQPVAFTSDSKRMAAYDREQRAMIAWDMATGTRAVLAKLEGDYDVRNMAFSPDGKSLAFAQGARLQLLDLASGKRVADLSAGAAVHDIAFSPDGKVLAAGCGDPNEIFGAKGHVKVWDTASGKLTHSFHGQRGHAQRVIFNHDGSKVLSVGPVSLMLLELR